MFRTLVPRSVSLTTLGLLVTLLGACGGGGSGSAASDALGPEPDAPEPRPVLALGMNPAQNGWAERGIPFADAMQRAFPFTIVRGGTISFDAAPVYPLGGQPPHVAAGWPDLGALAPGEEAGAKLFVGMAGSVPDGLRSPWTVTWRGSGSCRLGGRLVVGERERSARRVQVFVDPLAGGGDGQLFLVIEASDPADPVRDVHVWLPGMEEERPLFWPPYLEKVRALNAGDGPDTWRTLNWNRIRYYGQQGGRGAFTFDLTGRIRPDSPSQGTSRGVCPEYQVAFCNAVGANLHFNVPHQADPISDADYETFVRDALRVIRDGSPAVPGVNGDRPFAGLRRDLTVTLEYSNETWNPSFPVFDWLAQRAAAAGVSAEAQAAREIERVFAIAREVFSGADAPRLRTYVGGFVRVPSYLERVLGHLDPGVQVDAAGCAFYFRPSRDDVDAWLVGAGGGACPNCPDAAEVLQAAHASVDVLVPLLDQHRRILEDWSNPDGTHPSFELYEGGQSFVAGGQPWRDAAIAAQRDPGMFDLYVDHALPAVVSAGVSRLCWYSFMTPGDVQVGLAGSFGHWSDMGQEITLPVARPYRDEGVPKAAAVNWGWR